MNLLKQLTMLPGIPGHEYEIKKVVEQEVKKLTKEVYYDNLGSIIGVKGSNGPRIMIAGHMDEVGLIISQVTKEGFLKFQTIGGWFSQVMPAQLWDVHTKKGIITGVTGIKPPHIIPEDQRVKAIPMEDLFIDIGVKSREEAIEKGIELGQMITPKSQFIEMANPNYLLAKAFDNRVGTYIALEVLKRANPLHATLFATFTVQEEVGLRGAKTASYVVHPDVAISIDTGVGYDTPKGQPEEQSLGSGPQIHLFDRTTIGHPNLRKHLISIAKEENIPYQQPFLIRGGTDAGNMHLSHEGAPAVSVGIPTRYMHSHYSMVHKEDIEHTIQLLVKFVESFTEVTLKEMIF